MDAMWLQEKARDNQWQPYFMCPSYGMTPKWKKRSGDPLQIYQMKYIPFFPQHTLPCEPGPGRCSISLLDLQSPPQNSDFWYSEASGPVPDPHQWCSSLSPHIPGAAEKEKDMLGQIKSPSSSPLTWFSRIAMQDHKQSIKATSTHLLAFTCPPLKHLIHSDITVFRKLIENFWYAILILRKLQIFDSSLEQALCYPVIIIDPWKSQIAGVKDAVQVKPTSQNGGVH